MSTVVIYIIFLILIHGKGATGLASTASENYSDICPSKDNTVKALGDGYQIIYRCDSYPPPTRHKAYRTLTTRMNVDAYVRRRRAATGASGAPLNRCVGLPPTEILVSSLMKALSMSSIQRRPPRKITRHNRNKNDVKSSSVVVRWKGISVRKKRRQVTLNLQLVRSR